MIQKLLLRGAAVGCVLAAGLFAQVASAAVVSDNFNDNVLDTSQWSSRIYGDGVSVAETNGRLEITLAADAEDDSSQGAFSAGIYSTCQLTGDYDIQVDYELITWPSRNGVRMGMNGGDSILRISRGNEGTSANLDEKYQTTTGMVATADTIGKLRQTRINGLVTGYYYKDGSWIPVDGPYLNPVDCTLALSAWSHSVVFPDQQVVIAFDNLLVNQVQAVPEPSGLLTSAVLCSGASGMLLRRKR